MFKDPALELSSRLRGDSVLTGIQDISLYTSWREAYQRGRLHHAHLILGEGELIKLNTIRRFAASLLCESPVKGEPCGKCSSCKQVFSGTHPGYRVITPKGPSITIDQVRALKREIYTKTPHPLVFVISKANRMTYQAVSALLKVLEEPPGGDRFLFLLTPYPNVPLTILSRCVTETIHLDEDMLLRTLEGLLPEDEVRIALEIFGSDVDSLEVMLRDEILSGDSLLMRRLIGELLLEPSLSSALELARVLHKNPSRNLHLLVKLGGALFSASLNVWSGNSDDRLLKLLRAFGVLPDNLNHELIGRALRLVEALKSVKGISDEAEKFNSRLISYSIAITLLRRLAANSANS